MANCPRCNKAWGIKPMFGPWWNSLSQKEKDEYNQELYKSMTSPLPKKLESFFDKMSEKEKEEWKYQCTNSYYNKYVKNRCPTCSRLMKIVPVHSFVKNRATKIKIEYEE
jgi:hypothetical protein